MLYTIFPRAHLLAVRLWWNKNTYIEPIRWPINFREISCCYTLVAVENEAWRRKYFVIFRPKWALSLATFLHQNSGHFAKIVSSDASPNVKRVLDLKYDYRNSNAIARHWFKKKFNSCKVKSIEAFWVFE